MLIAMHIPSLLIRGDQPSGSCAVVRLAPALGLMAGLAMVSSRQLGDRETPPDAPRAAVTWNLSIPAGKGRFQEACGEGQWPMAIVPLAGFDDRLWMVGQASAWSSADGIRWNARRKTDWGERAGAAFVFFDDKLWMLGGMKTEAK